MYYVHVAYVSVVRVFCNKHGNYVIADVLEIIYVIVSHKSFHPTTKKKEKKIGERKCS